GSGVEPHRRRSRSERRRRCNREIGGHQRPRWRARPEAGRAGHSRADCAGETERAAPEGPGGAAESRAAREGASRCAAQESPGRSAEEAEGAVRALTGGRFRSRFVRPRVKEIERESSEGKVRNPAYQGGRAASASTSATFAMAQKTNDPVRALIERFVGDLKRTLTDAVDREVRAVVARISSGKDRVDGRRSGRLCPVPGCGRPGAGPRNRWFCREHVAKLSVAEQKGILER